MTRLGAWVARRSHRRDHLDESPDSRTAGRLFSRSFFRQTSPSVPLRALTPEAKVLTIGEALPQRQRGNTNTDYKRDTAYGIYSPNWQLPGAAAPGCLDAADFNNNGGANVGNEVSIFNVLFLGGPRSSVCGPNLTDDDLDWAIESTV